MMKKYIVMMIMRTTNKMAGPVGQFYTLSYTVIQGEYNVIQ